MMAWINCNSRRTLENSLMLSNSGVCVSDMLNCGFGGVEEKPSGPKSRLPTMQKLEWAWSERLVTPGFAGITASRNLRANVLANPAQCCSYQCLFSSR